MQQYILTIAMAVILALLMDFTRMGEDHSPLNRTYNRILFFAIMVVLVLFVGLRVYYNDTSAYRSEYEATGVLRDYLESADFDIGDHPGFIVFRSLIKGMGISTQSYLLITSLLILTLIVPFLRKYSPSFALTVFLFFATGAYMFLAAATKQAIAMAIGACAITLAIKGKWIPACALLLLAACFHPYVLIYAIVPLLFFKPWSKWTLVMIAAFLVVGFTLEDSLDTIVDITALVGGDYTEKELMGEGINVFRILVANVPLALSFYYRDYVHSSTTRLENLFINLAMINGAIMFVGFFGSSIAFSRLASYFTVFQCIALPILVSKIPKRDRAIITTAMIVGYAGFFAYATRDFDSGFGRITLWQYLQSLL